MDTNVKHGKMFKIKTGLIYLLSHVKRGKNENIDRLMIKFMWKCLKPTLYVMAVVKDSCA